MTPTVLIIYLFANFLFVLLATGFIRRYSIRKSLIDVPNERSSHVSPTPRGGGLSISLAILFSVLFLYYLDLITQNTILAVLAGGALVSLIGWLDDHSDLPALARGIGYIIAALWVVYWLGGLHEVKIAGHTVALSFAGSVMTVIGIAWITNLYNFMDGTDAIAAIQAMTAALFAGYLLQDSGHNNVAILCFVIVAANAGFLCWNWPPARIFMGDVGSCLLGFIFGCLIVMTEKNGSLSFMVWLILLSVFVADATMTLLMRIVRREKWYGAHRSHAYQRLVQTGVSHSWLAVGLLLINILLLWPLAYLVHAKPEFDWAVTLFIYSVMIFIWYIIQRYHHRKLQKGEVIEDF